MNDFIKNLEDTAAEIERIASEKKASALTPTFKGNGHPRFYELLGRIADLHSRKNHDYAGKDPLSNLRECEGMGIPAWKGVLVRLTDKFSRLKSYAKKGEFEVKDEGLADTLMDNAVYSLLAIILYEETTGDNNASR